jgi:large subunit ribosomal protein L4
MPKVPLYNQNGAADGEIELPDAVFGCDENPGLIHQVVVSQRANLRQSNAFRKNRSLVSGGGKKPWRQKGTGRARQGSIRAPHWVGGGNAFGNQHRNHKQEIPKKIRQGALRVALSSKTRAETLKVISGIELTEIKTKAFAGILQALELGKGTVLVHNGLGEKELLSARNIAGLRIVRSQDLSTLDTVEAQHLLLDKGAVENLSKRLAG